MKQKIVYNLIVIIGMGMVATSVMAVSSNRRQVQGYQDQFESLSNVFLESHSDSDKEIPMENGPLQDQEQITPFQMLKGQNADFIGWITIENTKISYPVMYTPNEPEFYLKRDFYKNDSEYGTPFAEIVKNESDGYFRPVIIYGHHMKDGSMFAAVDDYIQNEFWDDHQNITVVTEQYEYQYVPYLCIIGESDQRVRGIADVSQLKKFSAGKKIVQGSVPKEYPETLILITCNYSNEDYRTYLFCRLENTS